MSPISTMLAWAACVDVVPLVASVDAMIRVKPAIKTLQLCNRLGQPDTAAVTKVPTELIQQIEGHMLATASGEAKQGTAVLEQAYKCFKNQCKAHEHLTDRERRGLIKTCQEEGITLSTFNYDRDLDTTMHKIDELFRSKFPNILDVCMRYEWSHRHTREAASWPRRVGDECVGYAGLMQTVAPFLLKYYGLDVLISREVGRDSYDRRSSELVVHLVLPEDRRTVKAASTTSENCGQCGKPVCQEHQEVMVNGEDVAISAEVPTDLSCEERDQFTTALDELGLPRAEIKLMVFKPIKPVALPDEDDVDLLE